MTDLQDLQRAFAELERRADDHLAADLTVRPARPAPVPRSYRRPLLVGATAAVLLAGVATAAVVITERGPGDATATAAGSPTASPTAATSPAGPGPTPSGSPSASGEPDVPVATTTADLQDRFTAALAGLATFTVTTRVEDTPAAPAESSPPTGPGTAPSAPSTDGPPTSASNHDVAIIGVLTTPGGVSGGYDVQTLVGQTGAAQCAGDTPCTVTTLADGSTLAIGSSSLLSADGNPGPDVTYEASLVRPDGIEVLMHVSNQTDPKGMSATLSAQPPLTTAQLTAVVTSPAWVR